jgi:ATP-binding cassette subfamily B protein
MTSRKIERGRGPFFRTIRFVAARWRRQWRLALAMALGLVLMAAAELALPLFAGQMVNALADSAQQRDAAMANALRAVTAIFGLGAALVALRYGLFKGIVRFTLRMMSEVARETFWRVQRFSTDWQANSFAGATVRKISRGMWAFDQLNDTLLIALWPSLVVLLGATFLFGWHWPLMGLAVGAGSILYVLVTVKLSLNYITPATRLSNAWDSRLGGALADAVSCNAVVKAFGAEEREDARFGRVLARWQRRTWVTWSRATLTGIVQQVILMVLRFSVIGLALLFWWQGAATLGDVAFVLTAYGVIDSYLRDIGHHVHNVQRSTSDLEELVAFHDEPLGVDNRPGAREMRIERGDIEFDQVRFRYPALDRQVYDSLSIRVPAGQRVGLVGPSGSGKTTFSSSCSGCTISRTAASRSTGRISPPSRRRACASKWRSCSRSRCSSTARSPRTSPMAGPMPPWPRSRRPRGLPMPTSSSSGCRSVTPRWSASAASSSRVASVSG